MQGSNEKKIYPYFKNYAFKSEAIPRHDYDSHFTHLTLLYSHDSIYKNNMIIQAQICVKEYNLTTSQYKYTFPRLLFEARLYYSHNSIYKH